MYTAEGAPLGIMRAVDSQRQPAWMRRLIDRARAVDLRAWWLRWAAVYVALVTAVAIGAQATHHARYYVALVLLTLTAGVAAIGCLYGVFGILVLLVTVFDPGATGDHIDDVAGAVAAPINVLLFTGAAAANVYLLRYFLRRRRRTKAA